MKIIAVVLMMIGIAFIISSRFIDHNTGKIINNTLEVLEISNSKDVSDILVKPWLSSRNAVVVDKESRYKQLLFIVTGAVLVLVGYILFRCRSFKNIKKINIEYVTTFRLF